MSLLMIDKCVGDLVRLKSDLMKSLDKTTTFIDDLTLIVSPGEMDEIKDQTETVQEIVKSYIHLNEEVELFVEAANEMRQEVHNNREEGGDDDNDTIFQQKLHEIKRNRQNIMPENHPKYKELISKIQSLEALNSANGFAELLTPAGAVDGDGDLLMTQQNVNIIDPITKVQMTDPVKSKHCNHNYEKSAILNLLKQRNGTVRCPIGGCRTIIREADLESDLRLKRYIEMYGGEES